MSKYLFIAEKPSAMREFSSVYKKHAAEINKLLGVDDIVFTALAGHVCRHLEPKEYVGVWDKKWVALYEELPLIPSTWKINTIPGREKLVKDLKNDLKAGGYDGIIVGTDSDVEGYGIYYLLMEYLGLQSYKTLRFYETSLTEKDILASFKSMTDFFSGSHYNATEAFKFRSMYDWMLGMSMTICLTVRFGELTKYGSVKAPTLRLIAQNCDAIDNFKPVTTYGIRSKHTDGFESTLINDEDNKDRSFATKEDAEKFAASLAKHATVTSFRKEVKQHKAPKLFSLSDLQVQASKHFSYTPDKTLEIAQSLYEKHKILSYPRTSGNYLASGKAKDFEDILRSIKDVPDVKPFVLKITATDIARASSDTNIVNDKEVAKASHDALIPTGGKVDWSLLSEQERNVFGLVCKQFVAHFMPLFTEEKVTILLDNNDSPFKANGRRTIDNGFNDVFGKTSKDVIIPDYNKDDVVTIDNNEIYEKTSTPPARYTMGTIINAMKHIGSQLEDPLMRKHMADSEGIGTEATRSSILKDLKETGYISLGKSNTIYITDAGKRYIENIRVEKEDGSFDYGIADPIQVSYWSAQTKKIQLGELTVSEVMDRFEKYLNKKISEVKSSGDPIKRSRAEQAALGLPACPLCGGKVASGKFGYYCSTYKESGCKLSIPNEMASKALTDNQKKGLLQGKKIHAKGFKSKAGKLFEADIVLNKETGRPEFDFSSSQKNYPKKN